MSEARFEIELAGGLIRGRLVGNLSGAAQPVVLVCRGAHVPAEDAGGLLDAIMEAMPAWGVVVASFDSRCADLILDEFHSHATAQDVEEAEAVFDWLGRQPGLDADRRGVLGYSLGAIAAAALARDRDSVAQLCLLSSTTADHVAEALVKSNGHDPLINPDHLPAAYVPSLSGVDSAADAAEHDRPTLVIHGAADRFVPPEVSRRYVQALEAANRPVEHVLIARADHTFSGEAVRAACIDRIGRFFTGMKPRPAEARRAAMA